MWRARTASPECVMVWFATASASPVVARVIRDGLCGNSLTVIFITEHLQ
jgi:hypothetical protein